MLEVCEELVDKHNILAPEKRISVRILEMWKSY